MRTRRVKESVAVELARTRRQRLEAERVHLVVALRDLLEGDVALRAASQEVHRTRTSGAGVAPARVALRQSALRLGAEEDEWRLRRCFCTWWCQ